MRRTAFLFVLLIGLSAVYCSKSATGPELPVAFGIVSGNHQSSAAGDTAFLQPVVGQAYRDASGRVAFRVIGAHPLNAQTSIGTGVPNVLTQSKPVGTDGLNAYVDYATTDANGFVSYWYEPGTVATDSSCAEIRAIVDGQPDVVATTCASVTPGAPAWVFNHAAMDSATEHTLTDNYIGSGVSDAFGNDIAWAFRIESGPLHYGVAGPNGTQEIIADSAGDATVTLMVADTAFQTINVAVGHPAPSSWSMDLTFVPPQL